MLLDDVLENSSLVATTLPKPGDSNQKTFEKVLVLGFESPEIGRIKLTVGVKRNTHTKIQYGISVPPVEQGLVNRNVIVVNKKKKASRRKR